MAAFQELFYTPLEGLEQAVAQRGLRLEVVNGIRVLLPNRDRFKEKLQLFADDGKEKLLIVSDFDFTISRFAQRPGVRGASCHKVLEDSGVLGSDYEVKGQAVQHKYYAYEVDPHLDDVTKNRYMEEWVHKSHELLLEFRLTRTLLKEAVRLALDRKAMNLRNHLGSYFAMMREHEIPLLIFSAGIGEVLQEVLHQEHIFDANHPQDVTVISNKCIFADTTAEELLLEQGVSPSASLQLPVVDADPSDLLVGFVEPMIHVFNKKASVFLNRHPFFKRPDIATKTNLLMLGDSPRDVDMSEGMAHPAERTLNIGFVNDKVIERLDTYLTCGFDILLFDDCGYEVPMHLLQNICSQKVDFLLDN